MTSCPFGIWRQPSGIITSTVSSDKQHPRIISSGSRIFVFELEKTQHNPAQSGIWETHT